MPRIPVSVQLNDGDKLQIGGLTLDVWHTPGHAAGQLAFKMDNLLFVGDNIYRDGSVGVIDAHHGSSIADFISSLERILADDSEYLLPSHGPVFRRDNELIQRTIDRLKGYLHLADFGTCATDWPLMHEWEAEISSGRMPGFSSTKSDDAVPSPPSASRRKPQRLPGPLS